MNTLIIGGGAAGMAAAVAAVRGGERVTVWERNRRPLKKLGVTGNGRGNLLNLGAPEYYGDTAFALAVLSRVPASRVADFWQSVGVPLVEEAEGRVYPASFLASTAVDALLYAAREAVIETNTRATALEPLPGGGFLVRGLRAVYAPDNVRGSGKIKPGALLREEPVETRAGRVIVTVGGSAAPAHGTDGSAYGLLTALGHTLVPPRPALCALLTDPTPLRGLSGQRARASLTLEKVGSSHQSRGEILFAQDGVSGIAAMQLARFARPGDRLCIDLRQAVTGRDDTDVDAWFRARDRRAPLVGAATPELAAALSRAGLPGSLRSFVLPVLGTRGFSFAQVTAGGVRASEFDPATLQSRLVPGLFAAGEVLDVDGGCGGYNLLFAVAGGLLAGGRHPA